MDREGAGSRLSELFLTKPEDIVTKAGSFMAKEKRAEIPTPMTTRASEAIGRVLDAYRTVRDRVVHTIQECKRTRKAWRDQVPNGDRTEAAYLRHLLFRERHLPVMTARKGGKREPQNPRTIDDVDFTRQLRFVSAGLAAGYSVQAMGGNGWLTGNETTVEAKFPC